MSTILLYHQDDYMTSFEATVLKVDKAARYIVLDATAFYPTGGHQRSDQGFIKKDRKKYLVITNVQKSDSGEVYHYFEDSKLEIQAGDKVQGVIDWKRRYQHMQLHTAQHIFSRCARDRFDVETGRADFSHEGGMMVMNLPLTMEQVMVLEEDVNRIILENRKVYRTVGENGKITITIEHLDKNPCGGTHVRSTSEIDLFKITRINDRNIYYQVGRRARQLTLRMANAVLESSKLLQLSDFNKLTENVVHLLKEREQAQEKLRTWKEYLTQQEISHAKQTPLSFNNTLTLYSLNLPHLSSNEVKNLLKKHLIEKNQVWICLADKRNILISSTTKVINANEVLQKFINKWGMRGGGNSGIAQGGPVPENIANPLNEVTDWLLKIEKHKKN